MANPVYTYVTERIIEQLKAGVIPWQRPWDGAAPINYVSRAEYRGINTLLLQRAGEYLTFNQIKTAKGRIKKGAKSEMVVFYKQVDKLTADEDEDEERKSYFVLRYYKVFHLSDTEGIESKIQAEQQERDFSPIEEAEGIIAGYANKPQIVEIEDSHRAFYSPLNDYIQLPKRQNFHGEEEFYSTLFHELIHSVVDRHFCSGSLWRGDQMGGPLAHSERR